MKRFTARHWSIGALWGGLLALALAGCGKSDSGASDANPDKVKQEADRLLQENQKMFNKK
jgi:hypothetical protein